MRYAPLRAGASSAIRPREPRRKIGTIYRLRITGATRRKDASFPLPNPAPHSSPARKSPLRTAAGEGWGGVPSPAGGRPQAVQRRFTPAKNNLIGGWYQNRKEKQKVAADTSNRARAEIAKRSAAERRKLAKFLAKNGLNDEKIQSLDPVILNVSWMKSKLDDAREAIGEEGITVEYDNGGGQSGVRENPAFRAYEALWKTYLSGLDMLIKLLPVEVPQEQISDIKPTSVLTLVQNRRKQDA
nr:MAG TPA: hypothetical protein [Caudoviricetes sp.]